MENYIQKNCDSCKNEICQKILEIQTEELKAYIRERKISYIQGCRCTIISAILLSLVSLSYSEYIQKLVTLFPAVFISILMLVTLSLLKTQTKSKVKNFNKEFKTNIDFKRGWNDFEKKILFSKKKKSN